MIDDGDGEAGDADAFAARVFRDIGLPDLRAAADMQRRAGAGDGALRHGADVVGVDLKPDGAEIIGIDGHPAGDAAQRFGEDAACPAMKYAEGLSRFFGDRHAGLEIIGADFGEFDAQMLGHVAAARALQEIEIILFEPDHRLI